ncbi:Uncharacterized protein YxjI [Catalinimonas alkaloidigena]|uniref:Uncharacterized protein YxjI n=1 Tax=Catalinimonas alkaloidigena TaxID=1075417 RepID=A0A1G9R4E6_9BACT|nr:LURP-one-related family protein [Catalinimonas alkaloidigena]SDM18114.1 Uncharacterized protein YxjI [Catalinimonas alkaloidigena]
MRYLLKQKIWSFADTFVIRDAEQNDMFRIEGKVFSWGDKLSFQDRDGLELAFISQKLMSLKPRYEIYRQGDLFAEVVKEFSWFKSHFTLDVPGPNDYTISGSFFSHEYVFERSGREVARVSKDYFAWSDTYGVDIVDGEDDVAILATCIVIDLVNHDDKNG